MIQPKPAGLPPGHAPTTITIRRSCIHPTHLLLENPQNDPLPRRISIDDSLLNSEAHILTYDKAPGRDPSLAMLSRIYHFLKGPNPLHPRVWRGRLSPITFRRFAPQDLPQCRELYALNEPGRFPGGVGQQYEDSLNRGTSYFIVAECNGQIVASGGLAYFMRQDLVVLCFGLVHPGQQGRGIGTALLLARLSLLKPDRWDYNVLIFAVKDSIGFYRRFGFKDLQAWEDPQGRTGPTGHLALTSSEVHRCRGLLKKHGITVPPDEDRIPVRTEPG